MGKMPATHAVLCLRTAEREIKMDGKTIQTRANDGGQSDCSETLDHLGRSQTTFWGVLCRTCRELIAFDICPYTSFGPGAASMKPGSIRCGLGHNHIYYPRDFGFLSSVVLIPDATMGENRAAFAAVNPSGFVSLNRSDTWLPS
jgi:hypothetical protein